MRSRILRAVVIAGIAVTSAAGYCGAQSTKLAASHDTVTEQFTLSGTTEGVVRDIATVKFSIYEEGEARLEVTDAKGRTVEELVAGTITPGDYTLYYKPSPEIQSGEYFLKMAMNGVSRTERFLLSH
ncbi:MAG: hypothetical protein K1X85_10665 [Ignavibacteria bacterium]|nr:hypothetical protein [Ignavibacteria bacterium]